MSKNSKTKREKFILNFSNNNNGSPFGDIFVKKENVRDDKKGLAGPPRFSQLSFKE